MSVNEARGGRDAVSHHNLVEECHQRKLADSYRYCRIYEEISKRMSDQGSNRTSQRLILLGGTSKGSARHF